MNDQNESNKPVKTKGVKLGGEPVEQPVSKQVGNSKKIFFGLVVLLLILLAGIGGYALSDNLGHNNKSTAERQDIKNDGNLKPTSEEAAIVNVADKVSASVVSIVTNINVRTLFGTTQQSQAAGTGIIISSDGYIITNRHVIDSSNQVQVITSDGTAYTNVQIVGTDPLNDIAYLKVNDVSGLKPAEIGDSSTLRTGQQVVAIGNALGQYQNTVSSGIISGKGRPIMAADQSGGSSESLSDLLQTDAAINPGNSGGPLLNFSGQVVGINTAVASQAQGIGFAIPINATKGTTKGVLAGKGVQHAYLGVRYVEITPTIAKQKNLTVKKGALVSGGDNGASVVSGGPADKAGLKDGDVITKVGNEEVGVAGSVATLIGQYAPGETVELTYLRDGKTMTTKITLEAYSQQQ